MNSQNKNTAKIRRGKKIRLLPTKEQEVLFWKSAGTARWAFNYFVAEQKRAYQEYLQRGKKGHKSISEGVIRKRINRELKPTTHKWLQEVGSNVMKQGIKDADRAFKKYLQGLAGQPKFKSKHKTKPSFYVNYENLSWKNGGFHGEKIGFVKTAEPLPKLPSGCHYANPRISFDGKYWYLSFTYETWIKVDNAFTGDYIGIDLGLKNLAICHELGADKTTVYANINKSKEVRRLEKKLKRAHRNHNRKVKKQIASYKKIVDRNNKTIRKPVWKRPLRECKNIERQRCKIALIYRRLTNIRNNYLHQVTNTIVKTKPSRIVMEDLNVKGMMKNKHLAKALADAKFHEFRRQLEYKCDWHGIQLNFAHRFFPSSKQCSCCGYVNKELKLKDRVYICPACGNKLDRDVNAAMNLAKYFQSEIA